MEALTQNDEDNDEHGGKEKGLEIHFSKSHVDRPESRRTGEHHDAKSAKSHGKRQEGGSPPMTRCAWGGSGGWDEGLYEMDYGCWRKGTTRIASPARMRRRGRRKTQTMEDVAEKRSIPPTLTQAYTA